MAAEGKQQIHYFTLNKTYWGMFVHISYLIFWYRPLYRDGGVRDTYADRVCVCVAILVHYKLNYNSRRVTSWGWITYNLNKQSVP